MRRVVNRLTAITVKGLSQPGYYPDGGNLYLQVSASGSKSWIFRYVMSGKERQMGLGSFLDFSLAEARERAKAQRQLVADDIDPLNAKREKTLARALAQANTISFDNAAAAFIKAHESGWKNAKHGEQWKNTLATYASPVFGKLPVASVDTGLVIRVLEPIWATKTETATRLRGRIEKVLNWSTVQGYRTGENPARWKGHLEHSLVAPGKIQKIEHQPALPIDDMARFMADLRQRPGVAARCLEFVILTAVRSGEARGARWSEFDLTGAIWTIPADRMKTKVQHRVPLSAPLVRILQQHSNHKPDDLLFPGPRGGAILSDMTLTALTRRMAYPSTDSRTCVPHGFRSTFRDWAAERTNFPRDLAEQALAHKLESKVESAYLRSDVLEKRRSLMQGWADHCERIVDSGTVLAFKGHAA